MNGFVILFRATYPSVILYPLGPPNYDSRAESGHRRQYVNNEKIKHLRKICWFGGMYDTGTPERGCITGALPHFPLIGGQRGHRCPYITVS